MKVWTKIPSSFVPPQRLSLNWNLFVREDPPPSPLVSGGSGPWTNGDSVALYEWDFDYDGLFAADTVISNSDDFNRFLGGTSPGPITSVAGQYSIGLRATTSVGNCAMTFVQETQVYPLPDARLSLNVPATCPEDSIMVTNHSYGAVDVDYHLWIRHDSSGYLINMPLQAADTSLLMSNPDDTIRNYQFTLEAISTEGCENASGPSLVQVFPQEETKFLEVNYSFIEANCSPWNRHFCCRSSYQRPRSRCLHLDAPKRARRSH